MGPLTGRVSICTADRKKSVRHAASASGVKSRLPSGWWNLPSALNIRFAPTRSAMLINAVINTTGTPARSSSFASVAPLRVPVPQVAVRMTAWTPCDFMSWAISLPIRSITLMLAMLPVVT